MYLYSASTHALGGVFRRPSAQSIESQAACSLPIAGGRSSNTAKDFNLHGVSFRSAYSEVIGSPYIKGKTTLHTTRVSCILEGVNILNMVTADKIVSILASQHDPTTDDEPSIVTTGSHFENLRIAGHPVEIQEFAHDIFHEFDTYKKLQEGFRDTKRKADLLGCMMGSKLTTKGDDAKHLHEVEESYSRHADKKATKLQTTVLCSMVKQIKPLPSSEIRVHGPVVVIPHFGTVYLGEVLIKHGMRRTSMLRLELGSPLEASMSLPDGHSNGSGLP
ncbi:MAG TPA: hypothetical protein VKZ53_06985 [Candidatus Angelobacter sp.]|nr:hypothetical protein [Candidatus Angelobacter sp.]